MDVHSELAASATSALSFDNINYYKAEDSGYHTSFTPGSLEQSDIFSNDFDESLPPRTSYDVTPNIRISRCGPLRVRNDISTDTKRGIKRPHPNAEVVKHNSTTFPTPTTLLSGKIESLDVNEDKENNSVSFQHESPCSSNSSKRLLYRKQVSEQILQFPPTPIKRNCRLGCKSAKKLEFSIHSLSCNKSELEHLPEQTVKIPFIPILARPNQRIDILRLLCETHATPALENILQHLNNEDTQNFCLVSKTWCNIWKLYSNKNKKQSFKEYLKSSQENQENCARENVNRIKFRKVHCVLRDFNNEINDSTVIKTARSPPNSPRSNRFRKFTKSASLDSRLQLPCVKCSHPAKVKEEQTGEEWFECTNATCTYQFCRLCNCIRHPGKRCFQYDLNAPSPSKRKKCEYAVGTMKSKKNLRRLL